MERKVRSEIYQPRFVQVAEFLRRKLQAGELRGSLPAERILAGQMGVGRGTLRAALAELQKEGVIARQGRQGTKVQGASSRRRKKEISIGIVLSSTVEELHHHAFVWLAELRRICYAKNIGMEVYRGHDSPGDSAPAVFRHLLTKTQHDCWVLIHSTAAMQKWCLEKKIPVVVSGTVSADVPLPSVDRDYGALCRHAVGRMLQRGHRNLIFLSKAKELGGDIACRKEFLAAVETASHKGVNGTVEYHDGTPVGICRLVDRILAMRPRPTAWLVSYAPYCVTTMMQLLHRGIGIPGDISLICRDADPYFANMIPEPASYILDPRQHAKQIARLVQQVINGHRLAAKPNRLIPHMLDGMSLGEGPKA